MAFSSVYSSSMINIFINFYFRVFYIFAVFICEDKGRQKNQIIYGTACVL
jgi:hypothetical protein